MINDHISISRQGLSCLKSIETLRLKPYDDQTGKPINAWCKGATVGYGHLISRQEWQFLGKGIDVTRAVDLLERDLEPLEISIRCVIRVPLQQHQFDALILLAYNIGEPNFAGSSLVKLINDPRTVCHYATAESAWKAWNQSQGKVNNGLIRRRDYEWDLYKTGVYKPW